MTRKLGERSFEQDAVALRSQLNLAHPQVRAVSALLALPGLRAAWPMSVVGLVQPECTDVSGHGYDLATPAAIGDVVFGYGPTGIPPMAYFWGLANCYLFRADGGANNWADIGNAFGDFQILNTQRGLSLGGWFWWQALPGAIHFLMGKDDVGANRQYQLSLQAANVIQFVVWPGPVLVNSTATINVGWNHCVGIYDRTSQDLHVVLNGVVTTNAGAAPAALVDTGAPFTIGADGGGTCRLTGYASMCFLSGASMEDGGNFRGVLNLYSQQRELFGV
jgi:hypothetical protein